MFYIYVIHGVNKRNFLRTCCDHNSYYVQWDATVFNLIYHLNDIFRPIRHSVIWDVGKVRKLLDGISVIYMTLIKGFLSPDKGKAQKEYLNFMLPKRNKCHKVCHPLRWLSPTKSKKFSECYMSVHLLPSPGKIGP